MSLSYSFFRVFHRVSGSAKFLFLGIISLGFFASTSFANLEQTLPLPEDASQSKILYSEEWNKLINALETLGERTSEIFSSAGKVGIGTVNPTEKLEVAGQVKATGFCLGSDCKTSWEEFDTVFLASLLYKNITALANGNIGIGNTNPQQKLSVSGNGEFTGTVSGMDPINNNDFVTKKFLNTKISNLDVKATSSQISCSPETKGSIRYDETSKAMVFCDGSDWVKMNSTAVYGWSPEDNWGECNRTCGGGTQNRYINCKNDTNLIVDQSLCSIGSRPPISQSCNTQACATYYWEGDNTFQACSITTGRKIENIKCYKNTGGTPEVVADWYCEQGSTKTENVAKNIVATSNQVITIPKGVSGVTISGYGTESFSSTITGDITKVFSSSTETSQVFSLDQSKDYTISLSIPSGAQIKVSWNDALCKKTSDDSLIDQQYCNFESSKTGRPVKTTQCTTSWYQSGYSSCSKSCGGGTQSQAVSCRNEDGVTVADFMCTTTKPALSRSCNTQSCYDPVQ